MEGSDYGCFQETVPAFNWRDKKSHENSQLGQSVFGPRFESEISRKRSRTANRLAVTSGGFLYKPGRYRGLRTSVQGLRVV
jgi:hypothetical protein